MMRRRRLRSLAVVMDGDVSSMLGRLREQLLYARLPRMHVQAHMAHAWAAGVAQVAHTVVARMRP
jgi:hypothetical protein